jgi:glutamate formiminotransferase/formiminotetrahydrofolate cyclodeaminase
LTHYEKTPIYRVQEMVRREAAHYGLQITHAELVGLIPQNALMDSAKWYLQLEGMDDAQVLEYKLAEKEEDREEVPLTFIAATAAKTPTPGGGAVAALAGALAAALAEMVAGLTAGRKKYAAVDAQAHDVLREAANLRAQLTQAVGEDAAAFNSLMAVFRDKNLSGEGRETAVQRATIGAATVPLNVARLSLKAAQLAQTIAAIGNVNAVTDAAAGVVMAHAAIEVATLNVRVNAVGITDKSATAAWLEELATIQAAAEEIVSAVQKMAAERGGY